MYLRKFPGEHHLRRRYDWTPQKHAAPFTSEGVWMSVIKSGLIVCYPVWSLVWEECCFFENMMISMGWKSVANIPYRSSWSLVDIYLSPLAFKDSQKTVSLAGWLLFPTGIIALVIFQFPYTFGTKLPIYQVTRPWFLIYRELEDEGSVILGSNLKA